MRKSRKANEDAAKWAADANNKSNEAQKVRKEQLEVYRQGAKASKDLNKNLTGVA